MPVGTATPIAQEKEARAMLDELTKKLDKVRDRDREFLESCHAQQARFSQKQLAYLLADEKGDAPKGFPSFKKRYSDMLTGADVSSRGAAALDAKWTAKIDAMDADELEAELDIVFARIGDMDRFEADPEAMYMRRRWEALQ